MCISCICSQIHRVVQLTISTSHLMSFRSVLQFTDPVFSSGIYGPSTWHANQKSGQKLRATCVCVDQENKGSKIFITSLGSSRGRRFQFKQTFKFSWQYSKIRPTYNWPIITHMLAEYSLTQTRGLNDLELFPLFFIFLDW